VRARLALSHRIEEAGSWRREGYRSAAEQLARTTGLTEGEAKRQLAVAKGSSRPWRVVLAAD
jgi:hypothetical protein